MVNGELSIVCSILLTIDYSPFTPAA